MSLKPKIKPLAELLGFGIRRLKTPRPTTTKIMPKVASGLFALSMMFSAGSASAVTFNFVAERVAVGSNIEANSTIEIASGFETLTGTFSYDLTTPDTDPRPDGGSFNNTGTILIDQFQFDPALIGTVTSFLPNAHRIQIFNREADQLSVDIFFGAPAMNGLLDSDALPDSLIPLSLMTNAASGLGFGRDAEMPRMIIL